MKKVIFALTLMIGISAFAQDLNKGRRDASIKDLTPEQVATLKTKNLTLALDLSADQQAQIKAINLEDAKLMKTKMEQRKAARKDREAKKPTSEEKYAMKNKMLDYKIERKAKMKSILTTEQYAKWTKLNEHNDKDRKGNRGGKRKGRNGK